MLITNITDDGCSIQSNVPLSNENGRYTYLDGWQDENTASEFGSHKIPVGVYNEIQIYPDEKRLTIRNDPFGQRQLFLYFAGDRYAISDNFWETLELLDTYEIDWNSVEENILALRPSDPSRTFVRNLYVIPAGSKVEALWGGVSSVQVHHHVFMKQEESTEISFESAVGQTIGALDQTMQFVKDHWTHQRVVYGNSGGLDSRLIPFFASRNSLEVEGYFIGTERVKKLKSRSVRSADLVARLTKTGYRIIPFDYGNPEDRIYQDVSVNPLGPANHFKNAGYSEYRGALVLNAADSFVITNDSNKWYEYIRTGISQDELFRNYMIRPSFRKASSAKLNEYTKDFSDYFKSNIGLQDTFSIIRSLHQIYWNKVSPNGGFESLSCTGDFLFVYYPYLWYKTLNWQKEWYYDRKIQEGVFRKLDRRLRSIRTQKPLSMSKDVGRPTPRRWVSDKFARIDYRFRRSGIDYALWENSEWFRNSGRMMENPESPGFDELLRRNGISLNRVELAFQDFYDLQKLRFILALLERKSSPVKWLDIINE